MNRSLIGPLAVLALAVALLSGYGCGGRGGGSSSDGGGDNGGDNGGTNGNLAVLQLVGVDGAGRTHDLSNTVEGESLTIRALVVDRAGNGTLTDVDGLRSTAPRSVATVDAATDVLTIIEANGSSYTVRANYSGDTLSATFRVAAAGSRAPVVGLVRTPLGAGVAGATVRFLGAGTSETLAIVLTGPNGQFFANVPVDASRFVVDVSALRVSSSSGARGLYYGVFAFGDRNYDASLGCPAPLPSLGSGLTLGDVVFSRTDSESPPPPPDGCQP